jgi:hypothetical protein
MRRIVLRVHKLALKGFARAEGDALVAALRTQLARDLAMPAAARALAQSGDRARLDLKSVRVAPGANTAQVGQAVARRIAKGIVS